MNLKVARELKREFPDATLEMTRGNHLRLRLPNGRSVFTSLTPSTSRWMKYVKAEVRRQMRDESGT